jgi:8-oxo-dGTP diphosphatase
MVPLLRVFGVTPMWLRHILIGWTSPPFRVGTVGYLVDQEGRLLLARHSYRPGWGLPGGMLGWREAPVETVVRELREECGVAVRPIAAPMAVLGRHPRRLLLVYRLELCDELTRALAAPASPEIVEVGWFPLDDLPPLSRPAGRLLAMLRNRGLMGPG